MKYLLITGCIAALCATSCQPPEKGEKAKNAVIVNIDLDDATVRKLYDFQDARKTDSLLRYLAAAPATYRYIAALAFASVRDTSPAVIDALVPLLKDPVEDVKIAAAFALGQTGMARAEEPLTRAFVSGDAESAHQRLNAVILEAIGRCGTAKSLKYMASVSTYMPTDTLLLEGLCRAVYRFGLRQITDPGATDRMVHYVSNDRLPDPARLMAAHYLARTKELSLDSAQAILLAAGFLRAGHHPGIRMAIAKGIAKSKTQPAFALLSREVVREKDWRVQCNLIQALAKFDYDTVRNLVMPLVRSSNPHVSRTASEFFLENGRPKDGDYYWRQIREGNLPILTQINLLRASNRWLTGGAEPQSKDYINYRLKEIYQQSKSPYERAACLMALSEFGWNYRWIHDKGFNDAHPAVKSASAEALSFIVQKPNFYAFFGDGAKGVRRELYLYLREIVSGGDPGMIAAAAESFKAEALNFRSMRDSTRAEDFNAALARLKSPKDWEAIMALQKATAYFNDQPAPPPSRPAYNHPIEWSRLKTTKQDITVKMTTSKGEIVIELFPHIAPGSVANFLELTSKDFFAGKTFHRVVPNFVVQGGCPRGDGYGALDYSLRTEIGLEWYREEGYAGMASAGPDTEGTQFFITHSATPHLDGNYTIFGKVKSGMEVVHQLQPGDKIEKIQF